MSAQCVSQTGHWQARCSYRALMTELCDDSTFVVMATAAAAARHCDRSAAKNSIQVTSGGRHWLAYRSTV